MVFSEKQKNTAVFLTSFNEPSSFTQLFYIKLL